MTTSNDFDTWPVRRDFLDTRHGLLHIRMAGAYVGGRPPLILVHPMPMSSVYYANLMPYLAKGGLVVAVDTPGFGESFRPPSAPTIVDYAVWLNQARDALGFEVCDVLGHSNGSGIAAEMAVHFPDHIRRLVLLEPTVFNNDRQAERLQDAMPPRPMPDGSHLMDLWKRQMDQAGQDWSLGEHTDNLVECYKGGSNSIWGAQAARRHPLRETLTKIAQPVLVFQASPAASESHEEAIQMPRVQIIDLELDTDVMIRRSPEPLAKALLTFLDRA